MSDEIQQLRQQLALNEHAATDTIATLERQLTAAQAAIAEHNNRISVAGTPYEIKDHNDTAALDAAIAEARQPLVDELTEVVNWLKHNEQAIQGANLLDVQQNRNWQKRLAKVKEGK
jgi:ankyrin repeat protein